eukprot:5813280-Pyramimonas_sp.AAC.1
MMKTSAQTLMSDWQSIPRLMSPGPEFLRITKAAYRSAPYIYPGAGAATDRERWLTCHQHH